MGPPRIENNFSPSFLCPISAFSAFSARDSLTPRRAEDVKSGLLLRRPLSSDSQLQRLLRGIFPGQQCAFARTTPCWRRLCAFARFTLLLVRHAAASPREHLFTIDSISLWRRAPSAEVRLRTKSRLECRKGGATEARSLRAPNTTLSETQEVTNEPLALCPPPMFVTRALLAERLRERGVR